MSVIYVYDPHWSSYCSECGLSTYDYVNGCQCWRKYFPSLVTTTTTAGTEPNPTIPLDQHEEIVAGLQERIDALTEQKACVEAKLQQVKEAMTEWVETTEQAAQKRRALRELL